jgi:small-conductance mechanosensitive channel
MENIQIESFQNENEQNQLIEVTLSPFQRISIGKLCQIDSAELCHFSFVIKWYVTLSLVFQVLVFDCVCTLIALLRFETVVVALALGTQVFDEILEHPFPAVGRNL